MTVDIVGLKWYNIIIIYVKRGLLYMRSNQEIQHRNLEVEDYLKNMISVHYCIILHL